jgi:hypothetical protein
VTPQACVGQVVGEGLVELGRQGAARAQGAAIDVDQLELVVAHQGDAVPAEVEAAHAVGLERDQQAVAHGLAGLGDHLVGEAVGQVEETLGIGPERSIAEHLVAVGRVRRLSEGRAAVTGEGEADGGSREEAAAIGRHEAILGRRRLNYQAVEHASMTVP